jgi:hypothetical protein
MLRFGQSHRHQRQHTPAVAPQAADVQLVLVFVQASEGAEVDHPATVALEARVGTFLPGVLEGAWVGLCEQLVAIWREGELLRLPKGASSVDGFYMSASEHEDPVTYPFDSIEDGRLGAKVASQIPVALVRDALRYPTCPTEN